MKNKAVIDDCRAQIRAAMDTLRYAGLSTQKQIGIIRAEVLQALWLERDNPPSDEFIEVVRNTAHSASLVVTCEFCDRTYFGGNGDYDEGEYESLQSKAASQPEKYIEVDDFTSYGYMDGKTFVLDCECNGVRGIENWIWAHRFVIAEYFEKRAAKKLEDAQEDIEAARTVTGSVTK